uniref:Thymopoietin n=2 Tax=Bovinae TaxID=27592 RepID=F1MCA8_BOVIN
MPEFLEDPSVLTKEKLKSELVANNVTLPAGEQRKDVYVQLYLQHLTARNRPPLATSANSKGPPDFSSDEEREPTPVLGSGAAVAGRSRAAVGRKATKKTDKPRPEDKDDLDVTELSNEDLLDQLVKYGVNPGPIVGTTRKLYEKKLLKLREQGTESRSSTPLPTISSSVENTRQNGSNDSDRYSDNEEGKKKEHKKAKSTRDFVPFSELPTTASGGFFQAISFPEISTRPPLGRTEQQAAKKVHSSKGDLPREPLTATTLPDRDQKLASGGLFVSSKSSHDRCLEKSSSSSPQHELAAMLVSAAASPSLIKETTSTCYKDTVENTYFGEKSGIQPVCTKRSHGSDQSVVSSERKALEESEQSQVISPPLARAIRDYVNSLLVQGGGDSKIELKLEKREPLKGRAKTPVTLKQRRVEHNQSYSQAGVTETEWTSGSSKGGLLQALTRESTRGSRRTPRKRVETSEHFRIDGAIISESTPIAETIMASSNETLVVNRVTGNFKHAAPILPITEFSDIPRRTPKKPLTRAEVGEKTEERRVERDILKEMFPFEAATPTGISASCRRPIKGAAGRPLELSDFRMEESYSSKYIPKYVPLADVKSEKTKKGRSIPMWIKILLFVVVAGFLFLVYQAMETNQGNPFYKFLSNDSKKVN